MKPATTTAQRVHQIIAETTGNELEDILPQSYLGSDLEISGLDFSRVVINLNDEFGIELDPHMTWDEVETVGQLTSLVSEENELG